MSEIRLVSAVHVLGGGVDEASLLRSLEDEPHFIAADAGTTDAGPYALGTGVPAFPHPAVRADLGAMLRAGRRARIPVLIGSAGTAGGDAHVDTTLAAVREAASDVRGDLTVAVVRAEPPRDQLVRLFHEGRIRPLGGDVPVSETTLRGAQRIVAMMGPEPLQAALDEGADVVLAGRCSDAALFAAVPLAAGIAAGPAWHAGKVCECNVVACEQMRPGVLTATVRDNGFTVRPYGEGLRCTPQSIAAHSFYENADPFRFAESGGILDVTDAGYQPDGATGVTVAGSRWEPDGDYTVKLEGAALAGYQSIIIGGIRDPFLIGRLDEWLAGVREEVGVRSAAVLGEGLAADGLRLDVHVYGRDAVMGSLEPRAAELAHEVGLVVSATAPTQDQATTLAGLCRQPLLHRPIPEWKGGTTGFACLHNPTVIDRGPVYRFVLDHVASLDSPSELFSMEVIKL